jgi:pimeloyl-ACP methyl ester carboxylesterase
MALKELTSTVNGATVRYWQDGEQQGRVLLLIHGGLTDAHKSWAGVMPTLADEYHVVAPDLPGFGKSTLLPDMQVSAVVEWLKGLLDTLGVEGAVVVGSSFGALYARLFAATYPSYVPAVILMNGGTIPDIPPLVRTLAGLPVIGKLLFNILIGGQASSRANLQRMVYVKDVLTSDFLKAAKQNTANFAHLLRMAALHPIPDKRNPMVPTLLLWGANDQEVNVEEAKRIQSSIPGAKLSEIDACGHLPQLETPDVFVWQVKQFLMELSRPRKSPGAAKLPGAGALPQTP